MCMHECVHCVGYFVYLVFTVTHSDRIEHDTHDTGAATGKWTDLECWVAIKYFTTHISVKKYESSSGLPSDMGMAEWMQWVKGQTGNI